MRKSLKFAVLAVFVATLPSAAFAQGAMRMRAAELTLAYLEDWSSDRRTTLADVRQVYAPRVRFYAVSYTHLTLPTTPYV